MKAVLSLLSVLFFLSACTSSPLESKSSPERLSDVPAKVDAPDSFITGSNFTPISVFSSFIEVTGWFDQNTILYIDEQDESSTLYTYELTTGKKRELFKHNGWIVDVSANADLTLFAIQLINERNEASLYIVDREGTTQMNIDSFGESYSVYWNPYLKEQLLLVAYLPDWNYDVFLIDTDQEKMTQMDAEQTYFQWLSDTKVAYLQWEDTAPSFHAPLYELDVVTGTVKKQQDEVIAYMSFPEHFSLTVTVDSMYDLYSNYTFYHHGEPVQELEMPILNTYSEQWWTPFSDFDAERQIFYYLRPKYSADFISYDEGFELMAFHVRTGAEETLGTLEQHEPIRLSPDGECLLIGHRFERLFQIQKKEFVTILKES